MIAWLGACAALSAYASRGLVDADERFPVRTQDGWTIWVHRFRPRGEDRWDTPIVLGHGLMMNRWCWMLSGTGSLPMALAARGHDVYVAEYRGSGMSRPPTVGPASWTIQEHVTQDVPALIEFVRARTQSASVHWIGHSMGGIVGYVHACRAGAQSGIERLVTLGSPVEFNHVNHVLGPLGHPARRALRRVRHVRIRRLMFLSLPFVALLPRLALRYSGSSENLTLGERLALTRLAFEDGSAELLSWFLDSWLRKELVCPRELTSLTAGGFADLDVPTLVVAGQKDMLAPPRAVRRAFDETEGIPAAYKLFGDPEAAPELAGPALGHADLIAGAVAIQHVLPLLAEWLETPEPKADRATLRKPLLLRSLDALD